LNWAPYGVDLANPENRWDRGYLAALGLGVELNGEQARHP
jgi:hypothetical protein